MGTNTFDFEEKVLFVNWTLLIILFDIPAAITNNWAVVCPQKIFQLSLFVIVLQHWAELRV